MDSPNTYTLEQDGVSISYAADKVHEYAIEQGGVPLFLSREDTVLLYRLLGEVLDKTGAWPAPMEVPWPVKPPADMRQQAPRLDVPGAE